MTAAMGSFSLDRMVNAVEKVRQRLLRAAQALQSANVPYAVVGGNAVAAWVSRVDEAAVRNTQDVDILIRRDDLPPRRTALAAAGFGYRNAPAWTCSSTARTQGPRRRPRRLRQREGPARLAAPDPDVTESDPADRFRVLSLMPWSG